MLKATTTMIFDWVWHMPKHNKRTMQFSTIAKGKGNLKEIATKTKTIGKVYQNKVKNMYYSFD